MVVFLADPENLVGACICMRCSVLIFVVVDCENLASDPFSGLFLLLLDQLLDILDVEHQRLQSPILDN